MKLAFAVALIVSSTPLLAAPGDTPDGTQGEARTEQAKERPRLICRRVQAVRSQTRLGRQRVCRTAAQWRARSDISVDDAMDALGPATRTQGRPVLPQ